MKESKVLIISVLSFLGSLHTLCGQVNIQPMLKSPNDILSVEQLKLFNITNIGSNAMGGNIVIQVTDTEYREILIIRSNYFVLESMQIQSGIKLNWESSGISFGPGSQDLRQSGMFPSGRYNVCWKFIHFSEEMAKQCMIIDVQAYFSPPELIFPPNKATIADPYPRMIWKPISGYGYGNIDYKLTLVKVEGFQTPLQAIAHNLPLLSITTNQQISITYPVSAPSLDLGSIYAWQVHAIQNGREIAHTSTFTFRVSDGEQDEKVANTQDMPNHNTYRFVRRNTGSGSSYLVKDTLYFVFENLNFQPTLEYRILKVDDNEITGANTIDFDLKPGSNFLAYPVKDLPWFTPGELYKLEVATRSGSFYLPFKYIPDIK